MVKFKPFLGVLVFPNFKLKIKLGALLLSLTFLFNYQPALTFPPVKHNLVYAQTTQEISVAPQDLGVTFQLPFEGYLTTPFSGYHQAIDVATGFGMPIKPVAKGTVVGAEFNFFGLGLVVEVDHGNGYSSLYAHMGKIYTEVGKEVDENSFLGEVGMTGNTSGPHTHLEISKEGSRIDPRLILPPIRNYPKEGDFVAVKSATPSAIAIPKPQVSSVSAQVKPSASTPLPSAAAEIKGTQLQKIFLQEQEAKPDLKEQNITNVLNVSTPKLSASPAVPQGGRLSLKNFTLPGFKK